MIREVVEFTASIRLQHPTDIRILEIVILDGSFALEQVLDKGGLAGLSGPHDGDDPIRGQGILDMLAQLPGEQFHQIPPLLSSNYNII